MGGFLLERDLDDKIVGVVRVNANGQGFVWNAKDSKWVSAYPDWTGIGGSVDYIRATTEEAAQALLASGVKPDHLEAVMLGLDPEKSTLARVLMEFAQDVARPSSNRT